MPTYDYQCTLCGHTFEKFQSMSDKPLKTCPKCKGKVERLLGAGAGIIFKGSGFYATDHRSKEYKNKANSESDSFTPTTTPGTKTNKSTGGKK